MVVLSNHFDTRITTTYQGKDTKQGTTGEGLKDEWSLHQRFHRMLLQLPNMKLSEIDRVEQTWSE